MASTHSLKHHASHCIQKKALLLAVLVALDSLMVPVLGQLSDPIAHDDNLVGSAKNKFLQREASKDGTAPDTP
jgi:hypothetical protein